MLLRFERKMREIFVVLVLLLYIKILDFRMREWKIERWGEKEDEKIGENRRKKRS